MATTHSTDIKFVSERIANDIEHKLLRLQGQNEACVVRSLLHKRFIHALENEANVHSYRSSHPTSCGNEYNTHGGKRKIRKGIGLLEDGYVWAKRNFDVLKLNEDFIRKIAAIVEKKLPIDSNGLAEYRKEDKFTGGMVRHVNAPWTPPYPEKIPQEMDKYITELGYILTEGSIYATLEGAAYGHLHAQRIHAFDDGNSRVAKVVQNTILTSRGLPPAIIYPGESATYENMLAQAIESWRARTGGVPKDKYDSSSERNFYNFIAERVSTSLDRILK